MTRLDPSQRQTQPQPAFPRILITPEAWDEQDWRASEAAQDLGDVYERYALIEPTAGWRIVPRQPHRMIERRMLGEDWT
jgi:hypothetical protein